MENRKEKSRIGCRCAGGSHAAWQRWRWPHWLRLILGRKLPENNLSVAAGVIAGAGRLSRCADRSLHSGREALLCGFGAAGGYALFLLLGNLLFFGVHYEEALPVLLPLAGAGLLGALLGPGAGKSAAMHKSKNG